MLATCAGYFLHPRLIKVLLRSNSIETDLLLLMLTKHFTLIISWIKAYLKIFTKPSAFQLRLGSILDLSRSRSNLITENALLRQQLIILRRQIKRPQITNLDRLRMLFLARLTPLWRQSLHIIQPETLLRWHRDLFRIYWRRKSKGSTNQPRVAQQTIDLIRQMSLENRLWGAERIRGELLKVGVRVSKRTVQKYMRKSRRLSGQTWANFLKNHTGDIWSCDFTTVHTLFFKPLYIFIIQELKTRRIVHAAVTDTPTDAWAAQQLREATPWGSGPKYLIQDRDSKYGSVFSSTAASRGIQELKTPYRAPKANAVCERFMGSLKRECLDHMLILHQGHLKRVAREYVNYHNQARPHQGIGQRRPGCFDDLPPPLPVGEVSAKPILGGLHHDYSRSAYL